jgi:hypothetical protein
MLVQPISLADSIDNPAGFLPFGAGDSSTLFDIRYRVAVRQDFSIPANSNIKRSMEIVSIIVRYIQVPEDCKQVVLVIVYHKGVDLPVDRDVERDGQSFFVPVRMLAQQFDQPALVILPLVQILGNAGFAIVLVVLV